MRRLRRNAVKEAFDNLPSGVCFFNQNGMITLCNYQMYRLIFALTGRDLQNLSDVQELLDRGVTVAERDQDIFLPGDGSAWRFSVESVTIRGGDTFTQVIASDVTELYYRQRELQEDNRKLKEYAERMHRLSANIISLIREEEILNMKMRVHDDIGRSVIATRQFLRQNRPMEELDLTTWENAIRLLKRENELMEDKNALSGLLADAQSVNIRLLTEGELPEDAAAAELLIAAMRECMTNAVRHAGADEMYVRLTCDGAKASAIITNNGVLPEGEITEGGGLSSLRVRIAKRGGSMKIRSAPRFELTVSVPVKGRRQF